MDTERVEKWEYPIEALREAISNAICHRDYSISSKVQIRIFDDRIEVWGCGPLPEPVFEEISGSLVVTFRKSRLTEKYLKDLGLNERQIKMVKVLKQQEEITSKEYSEKFSITQRSAINDLKGLIDKQIVEKKGISDKDSYYVLAEIWKYIGN